MLHRILLCLLALALLNASPGFHWHDHDHASPSVAQAADEEEHESGQELCLDCALQAQQTAHLAAGTGWAAMEQPPAGSLHQLHDQAHPPGPRGGAIRVRGPPPIGA